MRTDLIGHQGHNWEILILRWQRGQQAGETEGIWKRYEANLPHRLFPPPASAGWDTVPVIKRLPVPVVGLAEWHLLSQITHPSCHIACSKPGRLKINQMEHCKDLTSFNTKKSMKWCYLNRLTPGGWPHSAVWILSLSQGPPRAQADWQSRSLSSSVRGFCATSAPFDISVGNLQDQQIKESDKMPWQLLSRLWTTFSEFTVYIYVKSGKNECTYVYTFSPYGINNSKYEKDNAISHLSELVLSLLLSSNTHISPGFQG